MGFELGASNQRLRVRHRRKNSLVDYFAGGPRGKSLAADGKPLANYRLPSPYQGAETHFLRHDKRTPERCPFSVLHV